MTNLIYLFLIAFLIILCDFMFGESQLDLNFKSFLPSGIRIRDIVFFQVLEPSEISYVFKLLPAKNFSSSLDVTYRRVNLVPTLPKFACAPLKNVAEVRNSMAFIERGLCSFVFKAVAAQRAGAVGVIISGNNPRLDNLVQMIDDGSGQTVDIPAFFLSGLNGFSIRNTLQRLGRSSAAITLPVNISSMTSAIYHQPPWALW